jgi:hypothetical protein
MAVRSRIWMALLGLGVSVLTQACGSSSNSPTGATPVPPVTAAPSATIQGTVQLAPLGASPAGAGVHGLAAAGGIKVSVTGTSLSTLTDDSGHFLLSGVPSGRRLELHFEAQGIDARLEVEALNDGQTRALSVSVSGSQALVTGTDDPSQQISFTGAISSIAGSTLQVAGRTVLTDGSTELLDRNNAPISFSALQVGNTVEIEGILQASGSVLSRKIKREDGNDNQNQPAEVTFTGTITSISGSTLRAAGRNVTVDDNTVILDKGNSPLAFSALRPGDTVEVEGTQQTGGGIRAKKIKREEVGPGY